ncbi:MAG: hypothetical protein ACLTL7_09565 [Enterocloster bolteae]|jgi:hypothetical protein|uniref:hypothetical protein n=1 Tax=Enterocloster bolteae TaxID=208479 RepID=UPI003992744C
MGCWGITAMQSDDGLDTVEFIRGCLPKDGKLELSAIIQSLLQDEWNRPSEVTDGQPHTSPMALAEIMVKFLEHDLGSLDHDVGPHMRQNEFSTVTSFTATKESIQWIRNYIADTLRYSRRNAQMESQDRKWGGWFKEENWVGWQEHMTYLVGCLDVLLSSVGSQVELVNMKDQECIPIGQEISWDMNT